MRRFQVAVRRSGGRVSGGCEKGETAGQKASGGESDTWCHRRGDEPIKESMGRRIKVVHSEQDARLGSDNAEDVTCPEDREGKKRHITESVRFNPNPNKNMRAC